MTDTTAKNGGNAKSYTTIEEEAKRLRLCLRNISQKVRCGLIPSYKIGKRILLVSEEVDAALAARCRREAPMPV
jgi:excisionase family DNA binding protein